MSSYKCLLVGDGGTGKTSLIKRLVTGQFSTTYSATIGYEIQHLIVHSRDFSSRLDLNIWDVSGQTSNGALLQEVILSGAHCAIIVFDVTSRITFNNSAIWYRELLHACGPNIPIVIVGNKIDMPARKIKTEVMMRKFSSALKYFDISVKTKFNIEQPFVWIASQLLQNSQTKMRRDKSQFAPENLRILGHEELGQNEADLQDAVSTDFGIQTRHQSRLRKNRRSSELMEIEKLSVDQNGQTKSNDNKKQSKRSQ